MGGGGTVLPCHYVLEPFIISRAVEMLAFLIGLLLSKSDASCESGACVPLENCPPAIENVLQHIEPEFCNLASVPPLVCCDRGYRKVGTVAKQQCEKYEHFQEYNNVLPIINGDKAEPKEFTHMAALGVGDINSIEWLCGGSLISQKFVLTAAHCVHSKKNNRLIQWARLGDLNLQSDEDDADPQTFQIKRYIIHPDYNPPLSYNDIALLELDRPVIFSSYVEAACLHVDEDVPYSIMATGWGLVKYKGKKSDHLRVAPLIVVGNGKCEKLFRISRRLSSGIVDTQLCAGGGLDRKDTCQGDSGGPLQFKRLTKSKKRAYVIFAITSFGKHCGIVNSPSVYTRIAPYVPWIESILWADEISD